MSLPRHTRNLVRKSSIIVPSKPLRGFSVHVPSSAGPSGTSWNTYHAAQVVTGMDLLRIYSSGDVNVHPVTSFQEFLQHPNYADEGTRLQSFKHWCGVIPATELADVGLYMVAHDTVKCYSCRVVIQGWKQGDKPIDMHCLYNSNCDFVKNYILKLSEIDDLHMASRTIAGRLNHGERPVIKERIKDNFYSSTKSIRTIRDSKSPQVPLYQATEVIHPACQWSVSTYGHLAKGSNANTSDDTMSTPPSEKMIMSEQRLYEEGYCVTDDSQTTVLPVLTCKICQDNKVDCVFLPCGDAKTCKSCGTRLFNSGRPCCFCNRTVATVHPIYL